MNKAWQEIQRLTSINARHRKGWCLGDITPQQELKDAAGELVELATVPADCSEMADVLGCLIGYCVKMGWSCEFVEEILLTKLKQRFEG